MKISGFTYIRNGLKLGYPFIESIQSVLSICDEFIIAVGDSTDGTREAIVALNSPKIKIIDTIWDSTNRIGGTEMALQAKIALENCSHEWALHIQADEVFHENDIQKIVNAVQKYDNDKTIEGFLFPYLHFYGSYQFVCKSPRWYRREIRMIRNRIGVLPYKDSQGFRLNNKKLTVKLLDVPVYHYSRVNPPELIKQKMMAFHSMYNSDAWVKEHYEKKQFVFEDSSELLEKFEGIHPKTMFKRVKNQDWEFIYNSEKVIIPFKYKFKIWVEKLTGWLPFEYKNYKLVK